MGNVISSIIPTSPLQKRAFALYGLVGYFLYQQTQKKKPKKKTKKLDDDGKLTKQGIAKFGKSEMWKIFTPTSLTSEGSLELIAIGLFHLYRVYQVSNLLTRLFHTVIF
jgi:hypothetical protein